MNFFASSQLKEILWFLLLLQEDNCQIQRSSEIWVYQWYNRLPGQDPQ